MAYVNSWGWAQAIKEFLVWLEQQEFNSKRLLAKERGEGKKKRIGE